MVLSDQCEPVSVCRFSRAITQHREPATRQERRSCGINWMNVGGHSRHWLGRPKKVQDCLAGFPPESVGLETSLSEIGDRATPGKAGEFPTARTIKKSSETAWRRRWDSNPRCAFTHAGFQDRCNRPLCHSSGIERGKQKRSIRKGRKPARGLTALFPLRPLAAIVRASAGTGARQLGRPADNDRRTSVGSSRGQSGWAR